MTILKVIHPDGLHGDAFSSIILSDPRNPVDRPPIPYMAGPNAVAALGALVGNMHPSLRGLNVVGLVAEAFLEWVSWSRLGLSSKGQVVLTLSEATLARELCLFVDEHVAPHWTGPLFVEGASVGQLEVQIGQFSMKDMMRAFLGVDLETGIQDVLDAIFFHTDQPMYWGYRARFPLRKDLHIANLWHVDWSVHEVPLSLPRRRQI